MVSWPPSNMTPPRVAVRPSSISTLSSGRETGARLAPPSPDPPTRAWEPVPDRPDPVALLTGQETTRVPELVPLRHERMLESPFTFYRGAAVIMAADLATTPNAGLRVQACGDAHLSNFGGFASPDRSLVFDINDFDETSVGPFEWDVKRLGASFEIAARSRELTSQEARALTIGRRTGLPRGHGGLRRADQPRGLVRTTRRAACASTSSVRKRVPAT